MKFIHVGTCTPSSFQLPCSFLAHVYLSFFPVGGHFRHLETIMHFSLCTCVSIPLGQVPRRRISGYEDVPSDFATIFSKEVLQIYIYCYPQSITISTPLANKARLFLPSERVKYCTSDLTCVCVSFIAREVVYISICVFAFENSSPVNFMFVLCSLFRHAVF